MALGVGKKISSSDQAKADEAGGSERMVAQPVTATLAQGMTVQNYDVDVTKMSDDEVAKARARGCGLSSLPLAAWCCEESIALAKAVGYTDRSPSSCV